MTTNADARPKVIFLVGAGLSASANLPTAIELADGFKRFIESRGDGVKGSKRLKLLHFYIEGGIRLQRAKLGFDPSMPVNIQEIAIAARHLLTREANPLAPFISGWQPHLLSMLADEPSLLDDYSECFFHHLKAELAVPSREEIAFLDRLASIAQDFQGLDVFTLNYDCCIEEAITTFCRGRRDFELIDGFSPNGWQPNLYRKTNSDVTVLRLYKMHGSLDWVDSAEYGLVSLRKIDPEKAEELYGLPPHLVFGTDVKLTGEQPFFSLAHLFFEALSVCSLVVAIGYSFGDGYVNSMIEQCSRLNRRMRILLINRSATELVEKNRLLKGNPIVTPLPATAKEMIDGHKLLGIIKETIAQTEHEPF
jgi:NAD-dependent SIR2 family protein deacetylase